MQSAAKLGTLAISIMHDPLYFERDKFIPTLERQFPEDLNEMLNHNGQ